MSKKRKVEIFSAGCPACDEAIQTVRRIACPSCETEVLDMNEPVVAARAQKLGINRVPAIVIEGQLANCCATGAVGEQMLRAAGVERALAIVERSHATQTSLGEGTERGP